jgi:HSP20 family protein
MKLEVRELHALRRCKNMRRETALRSIPIESAGTATQRSAGSGPQEIQPKGTFERNILSTLNTMERMIEETFHRPFFWTGLQPVRQLLHEFGSYGEVTPSCDIYEEGDEVVVKAELPGMKREDISVKVVDNNLVISGEKKTEEKVERKDFLRYERSYGNFNRALSLPEGVGVNFGKAKAHYENGILEVRIPKAPEKSTVRQITVE